MLETLDNSEQEDAAIVPEGGVLWSDVVRDFGIAYDNVFDRVGRKVYLDFNRSLTPGTKYIDVSMIMKLFMHTAFCLIRRWI